MFINKTMSAALLDNLDELDRIYRVSQTTRKQYGYLTRRLTDVMRGCIKESADIIDQTTFPPRTSLTSVLGLGERARTKLNDDGSVEGTRKAIDLILHQTDAVLSTINHPTFCARYRAADRIIQVFSQLQVHEYDLNSLPL